MTALLTASEAIQRQAVVREARSWLGTPYRHCADIKRGGVDCGMLLVRVFVDLGLAEPFDPRPYAVDFHLHNDGESYLGFVLDRAREVTAPQRGDVVVWRIGRVYSHGGIVTTWPYVVHAYAPAERVVEEDVCLRGPLSTLKHPRRYFSYWAAP